MFNRRLFLAATALSVASVSSAGAHEEELDPKFLCQIVPDPTGEPGGTLVVSTGEFFLYLVLGDGTAIRYGVGVGRDGFRWTGTAEVGRKAKWPTWTPPASMIRREPKLARWRDGMPGGPSNPLGARALYLFKDGRDTLYRIHGTNEPWTIGKAASSGCVRLTNHDITDLYDKVPLGTRVVLGA